MRRYLLFIGDVYYPRRGLGNLIGTFDAKQEALNFLEDFVKESHHGKWDYIWSQIWDSNTMGMVWEREEDDIT